MSSYSRFDRHTHMSSETRREILDIIMEIGYGEGTFMLTNSLYGLYDGYLYDEMISYADEVTMSNDLYRRILKIFSIACKYPKHSRYDAPVEVSDEVEVIEYREGMGVAEGKQYLATI